MLAEIRQSHLPRTQEAQIKDVGSLNLSSFDLENKQYEVRIYRLNQESAKAIAEAIGFTAKFDHTSIQSAYFDTEHGNGTIIFEMARNTKPTEVGLRYTADRWLSVERSSRNEPSRQFLKLRYEADDLPGTVFDTIAEQLEFGVGKHNLFFIRVNFKESTFVMITEDQYTEKLPPGAISIFPLEAPLLAASTTSDSTATSSAETRESATTDKDNKTPTKIETPLPAIAAAAQAVSPTAKYATYSMSEVDLLLKKQAEAIMNNINPKISSQQKAVQDLVKTQEKKIAKVVDDLHVYCERVQKSIDTAEARHLTNSQKVVDEASKQLSFEIEQFRSYLNRQVFPNLKSLDERIAAAIINKMEGTQPTQKKDIVGILIAILALVLSVANLTLIFIRH